MAEFVLTRLAKAIAQAKYTVEDVISKATKELESLEYSVDDIAAIDEMFLHCFAMTDDLDEIEFVILSHDNQAYIDSVSYRDEIMESGPFAGKTVYFPVPDTFSDD